METPSKIRRAHSLASDTGAAVRELAARLGGAGGEIVLLFASPRHEPRVLEKAIPVCFGDTRVVACSTAGEITPDGLREGTLTGLSLPARDFHCEVATIEPLNGLGLRVTAEAAMAVKDRLEGRVGQRLGPDNCFAILLSDGLSMQEELLASGIHQGLGSIPLVGGSAGDGTDFIETWVYHDGRARNDRAVLLLVHTHRRFLSFKTEHFRRATKAHVVTAADPARRIVSEIDAEPAAEVYARIVGVAIETLGPTHFARHPLALRIGEHLYVRSVQRVVEGKGLLFYCAIEEGIILHELIKEDMMDDLTTSLERAGRAIGRFDLVIGFNCILRHLEAKENGDIERIGGLLSRVGTIGFSTYGEQFGSRHINQTFTALAIGDAPA